MPPETYIQTCTLARHRAWLYAEGFELQNGGGLMVYKSPLVQDTDPIYEPVRDALNRNPGHRILFSRSVEDDDMFLGKADWTVYWLGER